VLVIISCLLVVSRGEDLEAVSTASSDKAETAPTTTKLTPTIAEDSKSKTEKRDSSDQTGGIFAGRPPKDVPFRPMYPSSGYYEAETPTQIFGPTTIRYTAAEAAPQPPSPYPQPQQQYQTQSHPHPPQIFNYGEEAATGSGGTTAYERAGPHLARPQPKYQQQQPQPQQQRIQYIIAIPLSYMRQLQQQQQQLHLTPPTASSTTSTSTSTTSTTSSAAPATAPPGLRHPLVQLLGPHRSYYQSDAGSAPQAEASHQQPYLQIPTSVLLAAAQQLQQHHQQQQLQLQAFYGKAPAPAAPASAYQPTQLIFQPMSAPPAAPQAYHQHQAPQFQLQRIFLQQPQTQMSTIYAEQPAPLQYTYPIQQLQRSSLKQQQTQKYSPVAGPTSPSTSTSSSSTTTSTGAPPPPPPSSPTEGATRHLPIVHYNPIYVQGPPGEQTNPQQQQQQQQHQFAILPRFAKNNVGPETGMPIQLVRLSPPVHHYHHYQPGSLLQSLYHGEGVAKSVQPVAPASSPGMTGASPAIIPYFSHPGAVHYGTHLYHPGAAIASAGGGGGAGGGGAGGGGAVAVSGTKQQLTATSGGQLAGGSNNIVKYP
ncbi:hypothetical protein KR009_007472, partial [Drosophila setifemur]